MNHDAHTLDGLDIEKTDSKQLLESKLKNGETLPSLEAYLDAGKSLTPMVLVLELKTQSTPERNAELARKVVDMVKAQGYGGSGGIYRISATRWEPNLFDWPPRHRWPISMATRLRPNLKSWAIPGSTMPTRC